MACRCSRRRPVPTRAADDAARHDDDRRVSDYAATANQIRTAPLWALRTRNRLMHDGLTFTTQEAIARHAGHCLERHCRLQRAARRAEKSAAAIFGFSLRSERLAHDGSRWLASRDFDKTRAVVH